MLSGIEIRYCALADSQLILEMLFIRLRSGCSLMAVLFFLMLMRTCCFILYASFCAVRPTYRQLFTKIVRLLSLPFQHTAKISVDAEYQEKLCNHFIAKIKAVLKNIFKLLLAPPMLLPPSTVVYEDYMIEIPYFLE